jgi:hypothetical protein
VSRKLDFASMVLVTQVSGMLDGEAQYTRRQELAVAWTDDHRRDGWTEDEWMILGRQELDVRRMPDGRWDARLTYRQWSRECTLTQRSLEECPTTTSLRVFQELNGFSWEQWLDRKVTPLPEHTQRPWSPIPDEWWPSIETAYQRYIHHQ